MLNNAELSLFIAKMITNRYPDGTWEEGFDGLSPDKHSFDKCKGFMLTPEKNEAPFFTEKGEYGVIIKGEKFENDVAGVYKVILQRKDGTDQSLCAKIEKGETYFYGTTFDNKEEVGLFIDELLALSKKEESKEESKYILDIVAKMSGRDKEIIILTSNCLRQKYSTKQDVDAKHLLSFTQLDDEEIVTIIAQVNEKFDEEEFHVQKNGASYFEAYQTVEDFTANVTAAVLWALEGLVEVDLFDKEIGAEIVKMVIEQQKTASKK